MKTISILGSTGSIGRQSLEIVQKYPDRYKISGLTCHSQIELLRQQIALFSPNEVAVFDHEKADGLRTLVDIPVHSGIEGLKKIAGLSEVDIVMNALVGSIGIVPTLHAIEKGKTIALANKESLVSAGKLIMEKAQKKDVQILPVDSEHSGVFQCVKGHKIDDVKTITLTCSGGPFKDLPHEQFSSITKENALRHPVWKMGEKISVDSATLMNKGFEIIEAHWLYGLPVDDIHVVVHPQSIVHSFVEFRDGSVLAQLAIPDMRLPIQYALSYPERIPSPHQSLNIATMSLSFEVPDHEKFPCLPLAYKMGKRGGTLPAVMNAANEGAVKRFLDGTIKFTDIHPLIKRSIETHQIIENPSVDDILEIDMNVKKEMELL